MSSKCAAQHGYAYKVAGYSFGNRSSIIHKIALVWISTLESLGFTCTVTQWAHPAQKFIIDQGVGEGGWCLQENQWFSPPASMTSRLASVTFKMANKVFIEETDTKKNYEFITAILFRFLGSGDFKISIVIEKQTLVHFWNETSSGVMNF